MRILLYSQSPLIAAAVSDRLKESGDTVDIVTSEEEAGASVVGEAFDALILDFAPIAGSRRDFVQAIRKGGCSAPLIALTCVAEPTGRISWLNGGADDCLSKPFDIDELEARVRAVIRRRYGFLTDVARFGPLEFDFACRTASLNGERLNLTEKERLILELLVAHSGKLVHKQRIYNNLYGFDSCEVGIQVVEVYVARLRKKLLSAGVSIRNVRQCGYQLCDRGNEVSVQPAA